MGLSGYLEADFNMDGFVSETDIDDFWKNNAGFSTQIP
jgi:hypothetical protein